MIHFTEDQIFQISEMATKGQTLREIASRMGVSTQKIKCAMNEHSIKTKKMGRQKKSDKPKRADSLIWNWSDWGKEGIKLVLG